MSDYLIMGNRAASLIARGLCVMRRSFPALADGLSILHIVANVPESSDQSIGAACRKHRDVLAGGKAN
jgi:hypothetical protein